MLAVGGEPVGLRKRLLFEMHRRSARKLWAKRTPKVKERTLRCAIILTLDLAREANRKADRLEREWLLGRGGVLNEVWSRSVTVQTDLSYVETQRWRQENLVWRSAHLDCPLFPDSASGGCL